MATTEYFDGDFTRTAIIVPKEGVSFDLVDELTGERIALINAFVYHDDKDFVDHTIIDVIDKDNRFPKKNAMAFDNGQRRAMEVGYLVCADFRR